MFFASSCKVRGRFAFHGRQATRREPNSTGRTSNEETSMKRSSFPTYRVGSLAFAFVTAMFFVAACGSGSPVAGGGAAKTAAPAEMAVPRTLDDAQAQLASAERSIFGAFGQYKLEPQGGFATPPGATTQASNPAAPTTTDRPPPPPMHDAAKPAPEGEARAMSGGGDSAAQGATMSASSSPCETACRALASMNRAATHICALAGDDSDSCTNARERVRAATERVRQSCSECANG